MDNSQAGAGNDACTENEHFPKSVSARAADARDIPELVKVYYEFMKSLEESDIMFTQDLSYWKERSNAELEADFKDNKKAIFIVEDGDGIAGFIDIRISKRPDDYIVKKTGHIESIYIKPGKRKKGHSKLLLDKAMEWFSSKKVDIFTLGTLPKDSSARSFWEKMGFREYLIMYRK